MVWFNATPLYIEIDILGVKFKQELKNDIKNLKQDIKEQNLDIRTEIHNTIDFNNQYTPNINIIQAPSDNHIQELNARYSGLITNISSQYHVSMTSVPSLDLDLSASEDNVFLFKVRYEIEKELNRIYHYVALRRGMKPTTWQMIEMLQSAGVLNNDLTVLLMNVWGICNAGVHGEQNSPVQIEFVRKSVRDLIPILKAIPQKTPSQLN
jgi:hypothetical protein